MKSFWIILPRMMPAFAAFAVAIGQPFADSGEGRDHSAGAQDKSICGIFKPAPRELMRELSPDRPDKTESPYTVDAGHFQMEMDFANFTQDRSGGVRTREWNVAPFNIKAGLLDNVDLQFVFDNYLRVRTNDRASRKTSVHSGVGDLTIRVKINLWGNDGGQTAFGLLPFITFPTNTHHLGNNGIEGGVILPLAVTLPWGFDMGLEAAGAFVRDDGGAGYHAEFINSITLGHSIIGKLGAYVEFFSSVSTERDSTWVGTLDVGLGYSLTGNVRLDCGCNIGVTRGADDLNPFTGVTVRF